jgi:tetratricopeptide (TPR) repeat protein
MSKRWMLFANGCLVFLVALGLSSLTAHAAPKLDTAGVTAAFKSNDNLKIQQAIESIDDLLTDSKSGKAAVESFPTWAKALMAQKRFDDVEDLAVNCISARPDLLDFVETCQEARVRAKLAAGKPQEALARAKALYNVCAMPNTSKAIDLISECIYDLNKDADPAAAVRKFKLEQIKGASATTRPAAGLLADVQIDHKAFERAVEKIELTDNGWPAMFGRGNLLLLAGRPADARRIFDKAYALASDKNLAAAAESIARTIRAEDGTVGRANAWIMSLRPAEETAQQ